MEQATNPQRERRTKSTGWESVLCLPPRVPVLVCAPKCPGALHAGFQRSKIHLSMLDDAVCTLRALCLDCEFLRPSHFESTSRTISKASTEQPWTSRNQWSQTFEDAAALDNSRAGNRVPYALIHPNAAVWPSDLRSAHVLGQEHPAVPDLSSVTDAGPRPDSMSDVRGPVFSCLLACHHTLS